MPCRLSVDFEFQHTAARRRLENHADRGKDTQPVSTHSRPKAAGPKAGCKKCAKFQHTAARRRLGVLHRQKNRPKKGFNTQPPEGGWASMNVSSLQDCCFNTQPPEGGWDESLRRRVQGAFVSTHSRPKAAGTSKFSGRLQPQVSTHSRPKAAGAVSPPKMPLKKVSTHSRPKAAGSS